MTASGQAEIWRYYQNQRPESFRWAHPRLRYLARRIDLVSGAAPRKVLTVGAGDGFLEERLRESGHAVACLDPDPETVGRMHQRGVDAFEGELATLEHDSAFDYAVASEVLEHIEPAELESSVGNLYRALRPGGLLLVTVPCREDLDRNTTVCPHCGELHHVWGHRSSFSAKALEQLLTGAGFHEVSVRERFFVDYRQLNWGGRLAFALKHLTWKLFNRPNAALKYYAEARK